MMGQVEVAVPKKKRNGRGKDQAVQMNGKRQSTSIHKNRREKKQKKKGQQSSEFGWKEVHER